jgi:glycosyltransferase involved in cell wall biosynthesis
MSVYNAAATVELAIRSIQSQLLEDWELVVTDDGSVDGTKEIIAQVKDSRIRLIEEPCGNLGLAARLNQCVRLARGRYIARMDGDDVAYPERLARQVRYLERSQEIDLLGCGAVIFNDEGEAVGLYPTVCDHEGICRRPWWGFPLAHPTWMGRRSWFISHPYREDCIRCEDQELLLRSFAQSQFAALEEVLMGYRMNKISPIKTGKGRLNYCRQLWKQSHDLSSMRKAAQGVLIHGLAFVRDFLIAETGMVNHRSRLSFQPVNDRTLSQWHSVWRYLVSQEASACRPVSLAHTIHDGSSRNRAVAKRDGHAEPGG